MTTSIPRAFISPDDEIARTHPERAEHTGHAPDPQDDADHTPDGDGSDPGAPWGRKADGTPRAKPGRPAGTPNTTPRRAAQRRATQAGPAAAPRPRTQAPRKPKPPPGPDYRGGINGLFQLVAAPLAMAGIKSDAAAADAAALTVYGPGIADALHTLALERPEIAAMLERILSAGPYGALIAASLPLVVQLLTNHGVLPAQVGAAMGAQDPASLVAAMRPDAAAA